MVRYLFVCLIFRAPSDCYQYFTGISGEVKSFNYPTIMLPDKQWTVCIRREVGYCAIQWSPAATTSPDSFQLMDGDDALTVILNKF